MSRGRKWARAVLLGLMFVPAVAETAGAGTVKVTTTADQHGTKPGECSLREAVVATNADTDFGGCNDSGGNDRVTLEKGRYVLTRHGANEEEAHRGDLDVTAPLEIKAIGRGRPILDGDESDRLLHVLTGASLVASGMVLENGETPANGGGAIIAEGDLTIKKSVLRDNLGAGSAGGISGGNADLRIVRSTITRNRTGPGVAGGGIFKGAGGSLEIVRSKITRNRSTTFGGGLVTNSAPVTLDRVTIRNNRAANGVSGGIDQTGGTLVVTDSKVVGNTASDDAGGIYVQSAPASLIETTVAGNEAGAGGGGVFTLGSSSELTLDRTTVSGNTAKDGAGLLATNGVTGVLNSTISGNIATDSGGGIQAGLTSGDAEMTLNNVTVAGNEAGSDGTGTGGGVLRASGPLLIYNSLLGDNIAAAAGEPDCDGGIAASYSLIENDCVGLGSENIVGLDPALGPLQPNGGPTKTHALTAASPALDTADPATPGTSDTACLTVDQRGELRPANGRCDMGAFERQSSD